MIVPRWDEVRVDTSSGSNHVKLTHIASGISATCDDTISEKRNRERCMLLLRIAMLEHELINERKNGIAILAREDKMRRGLTEAVDLRKLQRQAGAAVLMEHQRDAAGVQFRMAVKQAAEYGTALEQIGAGCDDPALFAQRALGREFDYINNKWVKVEKG